MIETLVTAFLAFASTNIDDLFILMLLFSQASAKGLKQSNIFVGQYLGIVTLIILSLVGSLIGFVIPVSYIGILGFFPIYLGLVKIYQLIKNKNESGEELIINTGIEKGIWASIFGVHTFNIASITIANGGDNIGIYVPLFATLEIYDLVVTVIMFLMLVYAWLMMARYLVSHPRLKEIIQRYNAIIFPFVLIALGIYILYESGTIRLIFKLANLILN
jgi:cadmium resistance transport/sequestration family protein